MRSLFAKILVWFLATATIIIAGVVMVSYINYNSERQNAETPFPILVRIQMREARHAYETGGRTALAETLKRFRSVVNAEMILADSEGHDLVTGEDRSKLVREARERRPGPFPYPFFRPPFGRQTQDGKYWFFVIPKKNSVLWFFQPTHIAIYALAVLLCWALARHLSSPVRSLQQSVEKFGRGDLSARAASTRRDELGALAQTFNKMADRIQTLVTAERRLLMDISHELRSPLARLAVAVELARSGYDQEASLDRIQKEADRLNTMVGELLEITRAEGDPAQRKHDSIRLDELVEEIAEDNRLEAAAAGTSIKVTMDSRPVVEGDSELLRRAIENVLRNAIRYSPQGQEIEVQVDTAPSEVSVSVRDYGPGVPDASLPLLFEPFYRVDSDRDRKSGGVGLGLSIARRSVDLHGGKIQALNVHPGLRVEITLPTVSGRRNNEVVATRQPALAPPRV